MWALHADSYLDAWRIIPTGYRVIMAVALGVEVGLATAVFLAASRWQDWVRSRRVLLRAWAAYLGVTCLLYLVPFRIFASDLGATEETELIFGTAFALATAVELGPRVLSLLPGLVRAAVCVKLIKPASPAPGWMLIITSPIIALFIFVVLVIPYQLTGNPFFALAAVAFSGSAGVYALLGSHHIHSVTHTAARKTTVRFQRVSRVCTLIGCVMLALGFGDLLSILRDFVQLEQIFGAVVAFALNLLVITVIGADLILFGLTKTTIE